MAGLMMGIALASAVAPLRPLAGPPAPGGGLRSGALVRPSDVLAKASGPPTAAPSGGAAAPAGPANAPAYASTIVSQAPIDVPGYAPSFLRGRTELFLMLLERAPVRPVAELAGSVASSGVRVEYTPGSVSGERGWGRFLVTIRRPLGEPSRARDAAGAR